MVELAVRAAAAVVRGPQPPCDATSLLVPNSSSSETTLDTQSIETSYSAVLCIFAKLVELPNREELYRSLFWRQYRNFRRKSLLPMDLNRFARIRRKISHPTESTSFAKAPAHRPTDFPRTFLTSR